jgi:26S proteasome regulatory subunit N5
MQEIHVETYGSLSKKDKVEFILEQMRLTLAKKDYIRAHIVSNKINRKVLAEMEEQKVRFFTLLADYHLHEQDALELAKDFYSVYSTPCILADTSKWQTALQKTILYLALAPFSNEQQDLMHKIRAEHEEDVVIVGFLKLLLTAEIIGYPLPQQAQLEGLMDGDEWKEILYRRVIQHNIRTASKYYQRITLTRLAQLLRLTEERCEQEIASMIADLDYCKMDRPNKIVKFERPKNPDAVLTEWASDIETLLGLVEKTTHLISKEHMTTTTTIVG